MIVIVITNSSVCDKFTISTLNLGLEIITVPFTNGNRAKKKLSFSVFLHKKVTDKKSVIHYIVKYLVRQESLRKKVTNTIRMRRLQVYLYQNFFHY